MITGGRFLLSIAVLETPLPFIPRPRVPWRGDAAQRFHPGSGCSQRFCHPPAGSGSVWLRRCARVLFPIPLHYS